METWLVTDIVQATIAFLGFLCYILLHRLLHFMESAFYISNKQNDVYKISAQVRHVLWKRKLFIVDQTLPRDFLTWHEAKVNPNYVLKPNVSLYTITKYEAVFVETPEEIELYRSDINPFLYMTQFQYCQRVITMPMESFHKVAQEAGDVIHPVIWLSNTGRCGSTILGQIFESVSSTMLVSENDALTNLGYLKAEIPLTEYDEILVSIVRMICKPYPGMKRFCIKPRSCGMVHMEAIARLFPQIRQLFLYRNSLETLSSLLQYTYFDRVKIWTRFCTDSDVISWLIPFFRKRLYYYLAFKTDKLDKSPSNMNTTEMVAAMWASFICQARDMKSRDKNIIFIKYEDLLSDAQLVCNRIFEATKIDVSEVETAVSVMRKHSQKGVDFQEFSKTKPPGHRISQLDRKNVDTILLDHELPLLSEDINI